MQGMTFSLCGDSLMIKFPDGEQRTFAFLNPMDADALMKLLGEYLQNTKCK